ncbi:MAG: AAA family ATPase [Prevotella sp.]|jgi:exonuclease SbcC|nr:AAA family ATPase [Prevotella sp.]MCH4211667.1 AAA family ATPase [Prevotella sp.]MCH4240895.1 AAA family ATPase [Prevotella sp.]
MKLQKLTIHNIASIEDAMIDFESSPLSDSEVFLITGKTGAGKSTILDAICLALFAETPRMENTLMQGDTQDADKTVKINDPRQLMRRNTGEAFARLTFTGSNGVHYEAEWSVARARKKPSGNLQKKVWTLTNLDKQQILSKDHEIEVEIRQAIGLDFNQFCRTTMLAQGEFTRFLNSKDDEKAAILEKITGVDIYSQIGKKVYDITTEKKEAWDKAVQKAGSIHLLTEEELKGLQDELRGLSDRIERNKEEKKTAEKKRDWIVEESSLTQKLKEAREEYQKYHAVVEGNDFKQKDLLVRQWNDTIEARGWMRQIASADAQKIQQQKLLAFYSDDFILFLKGKNGIEQKANKKRQELQQIKESLKADEEKVPVYDQAQTIIGKLRTITDGNKKITEFQKEIEIENGRLKGELKSAKEEIEKECNAAKTNLESQENILKQLENHLAETQLPTLRKQKEEIVSSVNHLKTAQERIENLHREQDRVEKARKSLEGLMKNIQDSQKKAEALEPQIHDAEKNSDDRKKIFERQKDTVDNWAQGIRSKLHLGDVCPVCGQRIVSEIPHEDALKDLYAIAEKEYQKAEEHLSQLKEQRNTLNASIISQKTFYSTENKKLEADTTLSTYQERAAEACRLCGLESIDENSLTILAQQQEKSSTSLDRIEEKILSAEKIEKEISEKRKDIDGLRKKWDEAKENLHKADQTIVTCENQIKTYRQLISSKTKEMAEAHHQVAGLMKGNWKNDWETMPLEFCKELKDAETAYKDKTALSQSLSQELNALSADISNINDSQNVILQLMPEWKDLSTEEAVENAHLLHDINELRTNVKSALNLKREAERTAHDTQLKLDAWYHQHEGLNAEQLDKLETRTQSDIQVIQEQQTRQKNEALTKETLLKNQQKLYEAHQTQKPELTDEETADSLNTLINEQDHNMTSLGEQKGAINQRLAEDQANRKNVGKLAEEVDAQKAIYQKWSRMNQLIGDATGNKFRKIAQSYVLSSLIHSANNYMKTLSDRYILKSTPGTFVISLEDAYQGYVSRPASTISGGESFLVSLSLALALSDIGQELSVDTLFIDEGFGTLSGEPLQKAIETLRSLHNKGGKHVGIISHVEELRERIPVQIQVNQEGNHSSSTIKIVPEE